MSETLIRFAIVTAVGCRQRRCPAKSARSPEHQDPETGGFKRRKQPPNGNERLLGNQIRIALLRIMNNQHCSGGRPT